MRQRTGTRKIPSEKIVKNIKRATRKQYSSEEKIRIVLAGLRGEESTNTQFILKHTSNTHHASGNSHL